MAEMPSRAKVFGWLRNQWPAVLVISFILIGLAYFLPSLPRNLGEKLSKEWLLTLAPVTAVDSASTLLHSLKADSAASLRFRQQFNSVERSIKHHGDVMVYFYKANYVTITMASIFGVGAAVLLIFVSVKGWTSSHPVLVAAFVVSAGIATLFTSFAAVYRQTQNVADNKAIYQSLIGLRRQMLTYAATGEDATGSRKTINEILHAVDLKLDTLGVIAIGFDESKIPETGALDAAKKKGP